MTAYIVRKGAQKKKGILEKREEELHHHIRHQSPTEKVAKAAEKVRDAQKAVIKGLLHETEAVGPEDEVRFAESRQQLEQNKEYWEMVTTDEIIEHYWKTDPKKMANKTQMATPRKPSDQIGA